ncbi:MAG: type 2 lanthipeptide synthetase LanM family protein [Jatrophihabitantaceae bacterium]
MQIEEGDFDASFRCLIDPALTELAAQLDHVALLGAGERQAVLAGASASIADAVRRKVSRLLLLELNAARVSGSLQAPDSAGRWFEFVGRSAHQGFWDSLTPHYPSLPSRLNTVINGRVVAAAEFARRFAANRSRLGTLVPQAGELSRASFGVGDSHRGGRSVMVLELQDQRLIYKPRSLGIDSTIATFLERLFDSIPVADRIRVPAVVLCGTYGWSEFIDHRYCESAVELGAYYTRLGHWLALARLFGTTDLHAENLIACGPVPVVIDCETLFTPNQVVKPAGMGDALDQAVSLLAGTVLQSGLLPGRGANLGWRGVDISAAGALPGQQPVMQTPQIVDAGTDLARIAMGPAQSPAALNHPSPRPDLDAYWPNLLEGFDELTDRLMALDRAGSLESSFAAFGDVDIRAVLRSTEAYAELGRMLWHPVSLHDEAPAVARAAGILAKQSEMVPSAPSDPAVIAAEVAELLDGDIPFFATTPATGWLRGPRDTSWGEPHDVLAETLHRWRSADHQVERGLIQSSLVCAFINDGFTPANTPMSVDRPVTDDLARRRQRLAADILERLVSSAVRGKDATATWIAPVMNLTGWSVQPLSPDGYSGAPGIAVLIAGYLREVAAGRALAVTGLPDLLAATIASMRAADDHRVTSQQPEYQSRPEPPGFYIGLNSQIWCWSRLAELGAVDPTESRRRTARIAESLPDALAEAAGSDLLSGRAGAIIGLLQLSDQMSDARWLELATSAGEQLLELALLDGGLARWASPLWPSGLGGFGHGATGIGWSLARLSQATGRADFAAMAEAAFAFEQTLWDPAEGSWRDVREESGVATAWCHGATGIGLASADLIRRGFGDAAVHTDVVRRAAAACWSRGMGWNHTVCHGDLGCWELLGRAFDLGVAPPGLDLLTMDAYIIGSLEKYGPASGLARAAFCPGLMPGLGGVAYQLLRMDPGCSLPSLLVPG